MDQTKPTAPIAKPKSRDRDKALEIIRSELNLEQWSIWQPSNSRSAPKAKIIKREITLSDGSKAEAQVEVGFSNKGVITTEDQKTLYALVKQWEERGRTDTITPFSLKRLAKLLNKKWGTQTLKGLVNSLSRLRATPFTWTNSYFDSSTGETVEVLDMFTVLSDLRIAKRSRGDTITSEAGYFKFHDLVLVNLQNNHTKPVLYEIAIGFKSEIAQLLYNRLDRFLFDKVQYERRTKELFEDLGLEGKAYRNQSNRKQALERAFKELVGKPLTTGCIVSATLETTADGKDNKAVFRKGPRSAAQALLAPASVGGDGSAAGSVDKIAAELRAQSAELVKYFFKVFHGTERTYLNSKAIDQAVSLIAQHGYEPARYVVDFAHSAAKETNFQIQAFGGILQYEARAIADYGEHQHRQIRRAQQDTENLERLRLEDAYATYYRQTVDEYIAAHHIDLPVLFESKTQEILREHPAMFDGWTEDATHRFVEIRVRADLSAAAGVEKFEEFSRRQQRADELEGKTH